MKTATADIDQMVADQPDKRSRTASATKGPIIYIDGKFFAEADAKVSVFDHGLLYGDGVFEGIRFYNGRVFRLEQHTRRLFDSAKSILLNIPFTPEEVIKATCDTVKANGLRDGYIRTVVTRGTGPMGLSPYKC